MMPVPLQSQQLLTGNTVIISQSPSFTFRDAAPLAQRTLCGLLHTLDGTGTHHLCEKTSIGRGPASDIIMNDERISATQCVFSKVGDHMEVEDRSSNGTFVNGSKLGKGRRYRLRSGDEIAFVLLNRKRTRPDGPRASSFLTRFTFQCYTENARDMYSEAPRSKRVVNQWQTGAQIGSGGFSKVFVALDSESGEMIAVKTVQIRRLTQGSFSMSGGAGGGADRADDDEAEEEEGDTSPPRGNCATAEAVVMTNTTDGQSPPKGRDNTVGPAEAALDPQVANELRLLESLTHPRIVQYLGFHQTADEWQILLEYVSGGSLQALIKQFGAFCESVVRLYCLQILQGLDYLHSVGVVHGDIKPANILVSDKGNVKLSDFGTSRIVPTNPALDGSASTSPPTVTAAPPSGDSNGGVLLGTPFWMSPEMIRNQTPTFASDIWAFGCVVLEMATGYPPWSELHDTITSPVQIIFALGSARAGPSLEKLERRVSSSDSMNAGSPWFTPALRAFVARCFEIDATKRPTTTDLLRDPFFTGTSHAGPSSSFPSQQTPPSVPSQAFVRSLNGSMAGDGSQLIPGIASSSDVMAPDGQGGPLPSPSTYTEHMQFLQNTPAAAASSGLTEKMEAMAFPAEPPARK